MLVAFTKALVAGSIISTNRWQHLSETAQGVHNIEYMYVCILQAVTKICCGR